MLSYPLLMHRPSCQRGNLSGVEEIIILGDDVLVRCQSLLEFRSHSVYPSLEFFARRHLAQAFKRRGSH